MTKNDILITFFVKSLTEIAIRMYKNVNIFTFSAILFTKLYTSSAFFVIIFTFLINLIFITKYEEN